MEQQIKASFAKGTTTTSWFDCLREACARRLGVSDVRREQLYLEILASASLRDASYWLQVIFSAGIATLGLVLNSVAVIIGAMLISPLMGPILASGLALAAGDIVLAVRAILNLALSCTVAIAFAVLLIFVLPFKEMTAEIAARTHPNTLDLVVALFSGAVGSVAVCKEVKGVVTSIPGVAIAVALMPPLCVTGYGLGIALSVNPARGWQVATGGGLLFVTNLIAITFTAMIVFLLLHIDTPPVKARVREWREQHQTSRWLRGLLRRIPGYESFRMVGSLPARLLLITALILLILVPLTKSLARLKVEIARQQRENSAHQAALDVWQQNFARTRDGAQRSYIGNLEVTEQGGKLNLSMRVFTGNPYTARERNEYIRQLASRLHAPPSSVGLQLIEVPVTSSELSERAQQGEEEESRRKEQTEASAPSVPSVVDSQAAMQQHIETAVATLHLPEPARLAGYEVLLRPEASLEVRLGYLSSREISQDALGVLTENLRTQLADPDAQVDFSWIAAERQLPPFKRKQAALTDEAAAALAPIADALVQFPRLQVEITTGAEQRREPDTLARERAQTVAAYLSNRWQIPAARIRQTTGDETGRNLALALEIPDKETATSELLEAK